MPTRINASVLIQKTILHLFNRDIDFKIAIHPLDGRRLLEEESISGDWLLSTQLSRSTGFANSTLISIKSPRTSFPEF